MGYLDKFREEAQLLREQQEQQEKDRVYREKYLAEVIQPRMQALYACLAELTENLNLIRPDTRAGYEISGIGRVEGFRQDNYRLAADSQRAMTRLTLAFICTAPGELAIEVNTPMEVQRVKDFLFSHNLRYKSVLQRDERHNAHAGVFNLEGTIPVVFQFDVDPEALQIRLTISNFSLLGKQHYNLSATQLDEAFFDKLAGYIVRDTPQFIELDISEEQLNALRESLKREQEQKDKEIERIQQDRRREEEQMAERKASSVLGKLRARAEELKNKLQGGKLN